MQDAYKTLVVEYFLSYWVSLKLYLEGYQSGQMGRAVNPLTSVFESSNLSPSTKLKKCFIIDGEKVWIVRVSYNGNTSDFQSDARSSILLIRSK